jgi:hypothetical protein
MSPLVTRLAFAASIAALALTSAPAAGAKSPPRVLKASTIAAKRIEPKSGQTYYSLSAVVKLDRTLTAADRRRLGLIASTWATRANLDPGTTLPDALFGGTSLGRVGRPAAHCYIAEVAQLHAHRTVKPGLSWRIALHDGHTVLRTAPRVTIAKSSTATESQQLKRAGC